jgi:Uma2 family endonuclease
VVATHRTRYTLDDYLALEASSDVKHEHLDGQIYAMAGGTPEHAALAASVIGLLFTQLRGSRCRPYDADLRVRISATGLSTYPDVTIVCGPRALANDDKNAVTNPTVVIEVTSPSTEEYDRGDKFDHYRTLPSLAEYVLVSHAERSIEVRRRGADGAWSTHHFGARAVAHLESVRAELGVDELYEAAEQPTE